MQSTARSKFSTSTDARLNACSLSPIHMPFICTNFSHSSLSTNESLAIIFTFLHTGIAINFGLVWNKTAILQNYAADGTLTCDKSAKTQVRPCKHKNYYNDIKKGNAPSTSTSSLGYFGATAYICFLVSFLALLFDFIAW